MPKTSLTDHDLPPRTEAAIERLEAAVQSLLNQSVKKHQWTFRLKVDGHVQQDNWLNIVVAPEGDGIHAYQYVEVLTDVEQQLTQDGEANVLLVPASPE